MTDRDRFHKFTHRARMVLTLAQEEAQRFQHSYIGTEHILLGLLREGEGLAAKVLTTMDISLSEARSKVETIIGRGSQSRHVPKGEIGLTPRAKKVIELAVDEARRLNHHYVGTEHLLLGLIREGQGVAACVLDELGINLQRTRREVLLALENSSLPGSSSRSTRPTAGILAVLAIATLAVIALRRRISRLLR